jgi:DNA-binding beta-propeller fold protein YncE
MEPKIGTVLGALLYGTVNQVGKHLSAVARIRTPNRGSIAIASGFVAALLLAGCGSEYRPVVSSTNPVGPASQPTKYAVAISSPSSSLPGLVTYVDFSGDTILSTPQILKNPSYFITGGNGTEGYVFNSTDPNSGSFDYFGLSNPTAVLTANVGQTTLPVGIAPASMTSLTPSGSTLTIFIADPGRSKITILNGSTAALYSDLSVPANPTYVVGADGTPRVYALSAGSTAGGNGSASAIEAISSSSLSISTTIPLGVSPTYGVMTSDDRRAFIMNKGSGTVSVINVINNALDSTTPSITMPTIAYTGGTAAPNPVWADLSTVNSELVVLNQGDGVHPGSLAVVAIPLCSSSTPVTNPNCNAANPVDATGFGQIVANVPVGVSPSMVSVLADGSRAYVINQGDSHCATGQGSVSVVNLITGLLSSTICGVNTGTTNDGYLHGHPNSVSATTGNPTGKVYVTSSDNTDLTVIYTDTDTVQTHIPLQGNGVRVLVTAP